MLRDALVDLFGNEDLMGGERRRSASPMPTPRMRQRRDEWGTRLPA